MTEHVEPASSGSSEVAPASGQPASSQEPKQDLVSYETHRRLLSEKKAMQERLAALERSNREREENEMRQKEDWKKILELREKELSEVKEQHSYLQDKVFQAVKKSAFQRSLGAQLGAAYDKLIDYDQIPIDPTTNSVDELALSKYVEQFKKDFKEIITPQARPGVSSEAPRGIEQPQRGKADILADFAKLF